MPGAAVRCLALEHATRRELLRRPGILLATLATGALVAVQHDLSASAFDSSGGLARELTLATLGLYLSVVCGISGVICAARGTELALVPELRTTPIRAGEYVTGRFAGLVSSAGLLLLALLLFAGLGEWLGDAPALPGAVVGQALLGVLVQAALFAALGLLLGAVLPLQLGVIVTVAFLVASRTLVPGLSEAGGALALLSVLVPDPARLELAREAGFGGPVAADVFLLAVAGAAAQAAALLVGAAWLLSRRES